MPPAFNHELVFAQLFEFLRFPSISTDPSYMPQVNQCASWLASIMEQQGLQVEQWQTSGAPTLFATYLEAGPSKPTVLFYGHYDVQPVDPLEQWITPPFEPTIRDHKIYARGASDDKGQIFYTLCAISDYLKHHGSLPINIKVIVEGEEESASSGLKHLLTTHKDFLKADYLIVVDCGLERENEPVVTLGARGLLGLSIMIKEAAIDLHSGQCGGLAYNPNRALVQLLSKLHDSTGSVAIPGFYDEITIPPESEIKELKLDFPHELFEQYYGFKPTGMEQDVDPLVANWLRPTVEINGLSGGYAGPGLKTVIPSVAFAKLSCRLVPRQNPQRIAALMIDYLKNNAPAGLQISVDLLPGCGPGFRCSLHSKLATLICQSYSDVFQKPCQKVLTGGSIPIVPDLMQTAGAECILIGTALPTDHIHAPNENFSIESFEKGYQTIYRLLELFDQ